VLFRASGLLIFLPLVTIQADTFTFATGANTSLGTAQALNVNPDLVINQAPPNFTLATAQPVSPEYQASEGLGSITAGHSQEFFSISATDGKTISLRVDASNPASQFPELLLYDPNGNLVAIAAGNASNGSSSIIDFTVPSGDSGNWTAEVVGSPNAPNPATNFFSYDLKLTGSVIQYSTDVLGALTNQNDPGFYAVNANEGDNLHFLVNAGTPATQFPELLLYDPNQNLVAVAAGNASNGSSSIIDFTVPFGDPGNWIVEVAGSPNVPNTATNLFNYDLLIQGDTGNGPVNPLASAVPEPSTLAFLAASFLGMVFARRRRSYLLK
jgi:hypothetical protein